MGAVRVEGTKEAMLCQSLGPEFKTCSFHLLPLGSSRLETSHHAVRKPKQPCVDAHVERNQDPQATAPAELPGQEPGPTCQPRGAILETDLLSPAEPTKWTTVSNGNKLPLLSPTRTADPGLKSTLLSFQATHSWIGLLCASKRWERIVRLLGGEAGTEQNIKAFSFNYCSLAQTKRLHTREKKKCP